MATKKSDLTGRSSTATKTGSFGKKKSDEVEQESQTDDRVPLYVRISKDTKDILERVAKGPLTNAKVIEALLENYEKEDSEKQQKILSGQYINPRKEFADSLASVLWAQHAFENNRHILATKLYKDLIDGLNSSEGYRSFCNYKLGLCWINHSYVLRKEALDNASDYEFYDLALGALNKAIYYSKKVKDKLGGILSELVMHYNLACCHSLRAQYLVEARLDPQSKLVTDLHKAGQDAGAMEKAWKSIGETWREEHKGRNVDSEAQEAFNELQAIYSIASPEKTSTHTGLKENSDLPSERIWLVEAALKDKDFIFLRSDKQRWQPEFHKWADEALQGDKSIADAIRALLFEE